MALDISTLVDIQTEIAAGSAPRRTFGRGMLITIDDTLAGGGTGKTELFTNNGAVVTRFGSGATANAAAVWFARQGAQALQIGRWTNADVSTSIIGDTPAAISAFSAANYTLSIGGTSTGSINLSSTTTYTTIAAAIQTGIAAVITGATFTYDATAGVFTLELPDARVLSPQYLSQGVNAQGIAQGTDLSPLIGMEQGDDYTYRQGHDAETVVNAANEIARQSASRPVAVMIDDDVPLTAALSGITTDTRSALRAWANGGEYVFGLRETAAAALTPNETTSQLALAFASSEGQTAGAYSQPGQHPEIALLAFASSQNLDNAASIATAHAKPMPGVTAVDISATQYEELKRKRANVVTSVGGSPVLLGGTTSRGGYWLDAQWWLLWLKNELELAIFNALGSSRRLTAGILTDTVTASLQKGVRNGGIQPGGKVNAATQSDIISTLGADDFDGTLTTGYVLWVEGPSERTDTDRQNRIGRFKVWIAPSDAIHDVMGDIVLSG